jgi:hypothetical protein
VADELVERVRYEADITDIQAKLQRLEGSNRDLEGTIGSTTSRSEGHFKKLGGALGGVAVAASGGLVAIAGGAAVFGPMILSQGAALDALGKKSATVFEGSLGSVQAWAKQNAASLGLTQAELVGTAAGVADLLKPMGFTADAAAGMATDMMDLSGALSAWTGGQRSAAEVSDIITKAMLGERDGLKELGISISEADVQARLARDGKDQLTGAALEQAKALATQQLIMEKSTDAQKAWTDGSMDGIKAQNEAKASLNQLKESFIQGIYPALQNLLPYVQRAAEWIGERLPGAMEAVGGWVRENWPAIKEVILVAVDAIRGGIEGFVTFVQELWAKWGDEILLVVNTVWPFIQQTIGAVIEVIRGIIKTVTDLITGDWTGAWEGIKQIVSGVWDQIKALVSLAIETVKLTLRLAWEAIRVAASGAWDGIKGVITGAWDGIKTGVSNAVDAIVGFVVGIPDRLGNLVESFATAGGNIASAMVDGIADGIGDLLGKGSDVAKQFANAIIGFVNRNVIDKINGFLEFKISVPFGPDININPPDLPRIPTFHKGGIVGGNSAVGTVGSSMRPDEVFALLQRGEMVLTADQQANMAGLIGRQGNVVNIQNVNLTTAASPRRVFDEALWRLAG